ncbi:unnamed protein product [Cuscuta epithymum]|uniref:Ubiquitin-like protease family profile domain-containing protein n=1 Tax=Cuscuta epithymum TaxID=186058 RepID=A0AAV0CWB0_9ASTE|nr:unnamed protein product [Cuscuta epithymum]
MTKKKKCLSSPSPIKQKFASFDFAEEDERVEMEAKMAVSKFKKKQSPQKHHSPISKFTFLSSFTRGERNKKNEIVNEVVDIDSSHGHTDDGIIKCDRVEPSGSSDQQSLDIDHTEYHEVESSSNEATPNPARRSGIVIDDKHLPHSRSPQFPADNEPVIVDSDDDSVSGSRSSKSFSIGQFQGLLEEQPLKCSSHVHEDSVVVTPDHIIYGSFCSTSCSLEFSSKHIQLNAKCISETRTRTFKWMVSDIVCIQSMWCDVMRTASLYLHLKSESQRTSDVEILAITVYNPRWSVTQEAIQSLDISYKAKWRTAGGETKQNELAAGNKSPEEPFHEIIYPKGDPDAISISKQDVDLLRPETFINDTIVDFYIMYLKSNIPSEKKQMFHFFNCFFFQKLIGLDKDPSQACDGKSAFQRIRRWTMKVDIFKKGYIFIPINFSLHWSLIVICHPGEVADYRDDEMETSSRVPCILHLDSLRGSHKGLNNLFQSYLCEEWEARHGGLQDENIRRKFLNLQFIHPKLPQQDNLFDCGLFLLHYVELFVEQAPINFNPFRLSPEYLSKDWFQPKDVSQKRDCIRNLIYEILKQNRNDCSTDYDYNYSCNSTFKEHASVEVIDSEVQIMSPPQMHVDNIKFAGLSDAVSTPCHSIISNYMNSGLEKLTNHVDKFMSPIEEEEDEIEEFMDISPAVKERNPQTELLALLSPTNERKLPFPFPIRSSPSSQCSCVEPAEWIVLDSQDENTSCDDDSPERSFQRKAINNSSFCNIEIDSTDDEANHIQKEEKAAIRPEVIYASGSKIRKDEWKRAELHHDDLFVEDSEDDEDTIPRSNCQLRKTIVHLSEDLHTKQFYE